MAGSASFHSLGPHKIELIYHTLQWGLELVITDVDAMMGAMTLEVKEPVVVVYTAQPYAHGFCALPNSHGIFLYIPNRDLDSVPRRRICGEDLWHPQSMINRARLREF